MKTPIPPEILKAAEETQRRIAQFRETGKIPDEPVDVEKIRTDLETAKKFNAPADSRTEHGHGAPLKNEKNVPQEPSVVIEDEETRRAMRNMEDANLIAQAAQFNDSIGQGEASRLRREQESKEDSARIWEAARILDEQRALEGIKQAKDIDEARQIADNIYYAAKQLDAERAKQAEKVKLEMSLSDRYGDLQMEIMDAEEKGDAEKAATLRSELESVGHKLEVLKQEARGGKSEMPAEFAAASDAEIRRSVDKGFEEAKPFTKMAEADIVKDVDAAFEQIIEKEDFTDDEKAWFEGGEKAEWDNRKIMEQLMAEHEKARRELSELTKPYNLEEIQAALEKPKTKLSWKELKMVAKHAARWATNSEYRQGWRNLDAANDAISDEREVIEASKPDTRTPEQRLRDAVYMQELRAIRRALRLAGTKIETNFRPPKIR